MIPSLADQYKIQTNHATLDQKFVLQWISTKEDYFMNTNVMNKINDYGNMKVTVKIR